MDEREIVIRFRVKFDPFRESKEDVKQYCLDLIRDTAAHAPADELVSATIDGVEFKQIV